MIVFRLSLRPELRTRTLPTRTKGPVMSPLDNRSKDFRVVALIPAYNEEDIIVTTLQYLISQDVEVYLLENWSTDSTYELASEFVGRGVIEIERFPKDGPSSFYNWKEMLLRIEQVAGEIDSDWLLLQGADEIHVSPWPGLTLRDGLRRVDREGFNCIDHTVMTFHPIDNGFVSGSDFESYFTHFDFCERPAAFRELNGWKQTGQKISLAESGGHEVLFEGRRVFPYKFLLKHYPVRSQLHGEKKVLRERKPRWDPEEKSRGWHTQYDHIGRGHNFLLNREDLSRWGDRSFECVYFGDEPPIVDWAASGRVWKHTPESIDSQLKRKDDALESVEALARESEQQRTALSSELARKEAELKRITNSLGWRLLNLYGKLKYSCLLPIYRLLRDTSGGRD